MPISMPRIIAVKYARKITPMISGELKISIFNFRVIKIM